MAGFKKLDVGLSIAVAVLVVLVLGFAGYFGYNVYQDRLAAENSSPAARVAKVLAAQVKQNPNDTTLRVRYGEALAASGKPQQAIEQLNAALKIDPKHTGAFEDLGQIAMAQNHPVEAGRYFQKVVDLSAGSEFQDVNQRREVALYSLGLLAMQNKDYQTAIAQFKAALRIRNDSSDTYYYLGDAFYLSGDLEEAVKQVRTGLAFDPNFAQAHFLLGDIYMAQKDKVNASYEYMKAATLNPNAPEPKQAVAQFGDPAALVKQAASLQNTDIEAALEDILIARNLDPNSAAAAIVHGQILVKRNNGKDALDVYRQALKLDPSNVQVQAIVKQLAAKYGKK